MNIPYAAVTRAKGWRFELDHERIRQSDTWALATPELRPWLLMLWMVAWEQAPCGSLPSDDLLIAARIGMTPKAFAKARDVLLRGWVLADDGRLYHPTLTERVIEMIARRDGEKARKAAYRASKEAEMQQLSSVIPTLSHGTDAGQTRDSHGTDATGTGTGTGLKETDLSPLATEPAKKPAARGKRLSEDWVLPKVWGEWALANGVASAAAVRLEADKFRDHWVGKSGSGACKADWLATWRNWVRNAAERKPGLWNAKPAAPEPLNPAIPVDELYA